MVQVSWSNWMSMNDWKYCDLNLIKFRAIGISYFPLTTSKPCTEDVVFVREGKGQLRMLEIVFIF